MAEPELPFISRHYRALAVVTLAVAAFNLTFHLGQEFVTEWDEALYANSAWETLHGGSWLGTTFLGHLDYYNTKPPLLVWLIASSFKMFGPSLWSLRIVSALSAWVTVVVMQRWTRRHFGNLAALLTALVLSTTFGFVQVHSGRSAATDAPFTLVMASIALILCAGQTKPTMLVWLGPLVAISFLLRGMGMLMPLTLVAVVLASMSRHAALPRWELGIAASLFLLPVGAWVVGRHTVDGWEFLGRLFLYDFVARTINPIEQHPGGAFYYFNILQKNHYDWLLASAATLVLYPPRLTARSADGTAQHTRRVLIAWAATAFMIPTLMQTKVPWYLNPFYPVFALAVGLVIRRALFRSFAVDGRARISVIAAIVFVFCLAETKLLWYSFDKRDLSNSPQALLLRQRERLRGHQLYQQGTTRADYFVATAIVGVVPRVIASHDDFSRQGNQGDYLLTNRPCGGSDEQRIDMNAQFNLCRRR